MSKPLDSTLNEILRSAQLPTLPVVASRLLELTAGEDADFSEIVDLIAQDVALSARLLKVANSAYYNFPQQICSINHAVSLLGINAVRSLVLSFSFLAMGKQQACVSFDINRFWEHSLISATAARLIGRQAGMADTEEIFTIGLLQNIGQLVFALTVPSRYSALLERLAAPAATESCETELEREYLGTSHVVMGQEVTRHWGLPLTIQQAVRHHHDPQGYSDSDGPQDLINKIVHLSDLVARIFFAADPQHVHRLFQEKADQLLGIDTLKSGDLIARIHEEFDRAADFFGVMVTPLRPVSDIIHEANIRLSLLHLSYEEVHRELIRSRQQLLQLREQLAQRNRLLERLANIDGLTEINNHRFFQNFLQTELQRSLANKSGLSLLLADVDHFKQFNDTHGHRTGDFILKELCRVAQEALRSYDVMARYGGEEFAFVLPDTDVEGALCVARKLCRTIAEHDFFDGRQRYQVSISIGVACTRPGTGPIDRSTFIDQADAALYTAKNRGRNQVALFSPRENCATACS